MILEIIRFEDDICKFQNGFNTTCRYGRKWYDRLKAADFVKLSNKDGTSMITAQVTCKTLAYYSELSSIEIASNHTYRNDKELFEAMRRFYPEMTFESLVSVIGFHI